MKSALVVVLFAISAFSQDQSAVVSTEAACGPKDAHFDAETSTARPPTQLEAGKSQVYVIEVFDKVVGEIARPTLRIGLDGTWVGAGRGNSYVSFSAEPGEHHLCASWQSHLKRLSREAAFAGFTADEGKAYYFRARITEHGGSTGASTFSLDLEPVNSDEGKYLVSSSPVSVSRLRQ